LSAADRKRAGDGVMAIANYCLGLSKDHPEVSNSVLDAAAEARYDLPELLRKDPDTYYDFPYAGHRTMRELVGEARDAALSYGCDPSTGRAFSTALETLPPAR
jgi:hypothetical protein